MKSTYIAHFEVDGQRISRKTKGNADKPYVIAILCRENGYSFTNKLNRLITYREDWGDVFWYTSHEAAAKDLNAMREMHASEFHMDVMSFKSNQHLDEIPAYTGFIIAPVEKAEGQQSKPKDSKLSEKGKNAQKAVEHKSAGPEWDQMVEGFLENYSPSTQENYRRLLRKFGLFVLERQGGYDGR